MLARNGWIGVLDRKYESKRVEDILVYEVRTVLLLPYKLKSVFRSQKLRSYILPDRWGVGVVLNLLTGSCQTFPQYQDGLCFAPPHEGLFCSSGPLEAIGENIWGTIDEQYQSGLVRKLCSMPFPPPQYDRLHQRNRSWLLSLPQAEFSLSVAIVDCG